MVCDKSRDGKHSVSEKDGLLICFFCDEPYSSVICRLCCKANGVEI
jgi:hypothetical protein